MDHPGDQLNGGQDELDSSLQDEPFVQPSEFEASIAGDPAEAEVHLNAWYAIHYEHIVEQLLDSIRPHVRSTHTIAFVRTTLHGHVRGIIRAIFAPPVVPLYIRGVGLEVAEFCEGSVVALTAFRLALRQSLVDDLPYWLLPVVTNGFESVLTEIVWGFAVTGESLEQARIATPSASTATDYRIDPAWYQAIIDQSPDAISVFDVTIGKLLTGNRALEEMFGYTLAEFDAVPNEMIVGPESPDADHDVGVDLTAGRIPCFRRTSAFRHKSGHMVWFNVTAWLVRDADGVPVQVVYAYLPIVHDTETERHWQHADRRFRYLAQLSNDPTFIVRTDGNIKYASPATERSLGVDPDEIVGSALAEFVVAGDQTRIGEFLLQLDSAPRHLERIEVRLLRRDGQWRWFELTGVNVLDVPDIEGFSVQARDISDRKRMEELLARQALIDELTGLLNRRGALDRIEQAVLRAASGNEQTCLLYVDLDEFKDINDRFGHQTGDEVLSEIGNRLAGAVGFHIAAARIGGDEFVVVLEHTDEKSALAVADQVLALIAEPIAVGGYMHHIVGSIGLALTDGDRHTSASLLRAADMALYKAKSQHDGRPVLYVDVEASTL